MAAAHAPSLLAELRPEQVTAIIDSREQLPFVLDPLRVREGSLQTGDYSIVGLTDRIAIERKSLSDLVGCCGVERERFQRELERLRAYECRAVIVEASWSDLEAGEWRSQISAQSVVASVLGWICYGIPFVMAGDRVRAQRYCGRMLFLAARRYYRIGRGFALEAIGAEGAKEGAA